ncbi:hypothetical protein [Thermomonas sp.]|uniref:hypothetical protein n=1 Tax=Thermomonas sp. TaxID=1971895 RepID=UPI00391C1F40
MHKPQSSMALFAGVVAAFATCAAFAQEAQQAPKTVPAQAAEQMPTQARDASADGMAHAAGAGMAGDPMAAKADKSEAKTDGKADDTKAAPAKGDDAAKTDPR